MKKFSWNTFLFGENSGYPETQPKSLDEAVQVIEKPKPQPPKRIKSSNQTLVQEIHATFDKAMDEILADAGITRNFHDINEALFKKIKQLQSLGFHNSPECKAAEQTIKENREINRLNILNKQIVQDIAYFNHKYPQYKVITFDAWGEICKKYQLGWAAVRFFEGTVPQKNLDDLLKANIHDSDKARIDHSNFRGGIRDAESAEKAFGLFNQGYSTWDWHNKDLDNPTLAKGAPITWGRTSPLIIAAPPKDFSQDLRLDKFGRMKSIPDLKDPIVGQVVTRGPLHYVLIITAWGDEASDPMIVNHRNN